MSGFTPGPWKTDGEVASMEINGRLVPVYEVMAESDACWVAQVLDHHRCGATAPGAANARLIAAAPRMYEALKTKLKWCREHGDCADAALMADEYCSDECVAMAAVLTEIEGKSNVKA